MVANLKPRLWTTSSVEETRELGASLARDLAPDGLLLLIGGLGAGKTALTQGLARGLGIDPNDVQSPTYTLIREHENAGGSRLIHLDLYRLEPREAAALGLDELLAGPGVKVVEWAERLPFDPGPALRLELRMLPEGRREIRELGEGLQA